MSKSWERIKNILLELRKTRGAVANFCQRSGISRNTVEPWLNGPTTPSIDSLDDIAKGLGLSVMELIGDAAKPHRAKEDVEASMLLELLKNFSPMKRELIGVISALDDDRLKRLLAEAHALKKDAP